MRFFISALLAVLALAQPIVRRSVPNAVPTSSDASYGFVLILSSLLRFRFVLHSSLMPLCEQPNLSNLLDRRQHHRLVVLLLRFNLDLLDR